ncbi:MAG: cytochrome c biogenesis protein CcsA [Desulfovibrionaceae bacterium]|nr:cytochrome c biogenesis protein CcsA [Desulfovibrionaceae bacterium]
MTRFLLCLGALGMASSAYLVAYYAPVEATMGLSQKIFYIHLPLAWWGLVSFALVFFASLAYLWKRHSRFAHLALASCEVGEVCAILTVISGMIWGRAAWGVWWTWDPRLTTALVLCFIYAGYLLVHGLDFAAERRRLVLAVIGCVAFIDVPLVFFSSRIWRSIHPAVFTKSGAGLTEEMLLTVLCAVFALGFFVLGLIRLRYQILLLEERLTAHSRKL